MPIYFPRASSNEDVVKPGSMPASLRSSVLLLPPKFERLALAPISRLPGNGAALDKQISEIQPLTLACKIQTKDVKSTCGIGADATSDPPMHGQMRHLPLFVVRLPWGDCESVKGPCPCKCVAMVEQ